MHSTCSSAVPQLFKMNLICSFLLWRLHLEYLIPIWLLFREKKNKVKYHTHNLSNCIRLMQSMIVNASKEVKEGRENIQQIPPNVMPSW